MAAPLDIAVQTSPQPTNKVQAAGNIGGSLAGIVAGVMAGYAGPALIEMMGVWGANHPSTAQLIVMAVTTVAAALAGKYGGQAAAFNVLDKPNQALVAVPPAP
jgi:NhaP-type Na+/H+ or K+/H+ antiporter